MPADRPQMLDWVTDPVAGRELHFYARGSGWAGVSYTTLAAQARRVAAAVRERGLVPGEIVAVAQGVSAEMIASLCGAMLAGATVCVLPTSLPMQRGDAQAAQVRHLVRLARPRLVICGEDEVNGMAGLVGAGGTAVTFAGLVATAQLKLPDGSGVPHSYPLLQFTSGSSGDQRGMLISGAALDANHAGLYQGTGLADGDALISWLPVHHDMGLIGLLLGTLYGQYNGYFMSPHQFIREPHAYIRCISDKRVAVTGIPNFGLDYLCKRVSASQLLGVDLSSLRSIFVGAERVTPSTLEKFTEKFSRAGLSPRALSPSYGSAEATLAVSVTRFDAPWRAVRPAGHSGPAAVVSCGPPLPGVDVRILDEQDREVDDGEIGEIVVRGPSIASAHPAPGGAAPGSATGAGPGGAGASSLCGRELRTGDAGFLDQGELFVVGRYGDGLKIRGQMVFAENIESELMARGMRPGDATVLLGELDQPTVVFLFVGQHPDRDEIALEVARELVGTTAVHAVDLPGGRLRKTSSGKPRRRIMWREFTNGDLQGSSRRLDLRLSAPQAVSS